MTDHEGSSVPSAGRALVVVPTGKTSAHRQRQEPTAPPRKRVLAYVLMAVAGFVAIGSYFHWQHFAASREMQREQQDFVPQVRTATVERVDKPVELTLPGQTEAFDNANLFPRATGYVKQRLVDIGSRVRKGDLMLVIEAPDLDQQLAQAQAQLGQSRAAVQQATAAVQSAQANTKLADVTKYRATTLAGQGWETKQNADNAIANYSVQNAGVASAEAGVAVALANLKAQQATVDRLQALTAFERITAPFDGVVTARNVDEGDLLTSDSSGGTPIFSVAADAVLRIAVYVPQSSAIDIRDGLEATISFPEMPSRTFIGRVARTAVALQAASRSMLAEVDVPNFGGTLRPGLFINVTFKIPRQAPGIVVPDEALVFDAQGLRVAIVGPDDAVHFRKVVVYRDFGTSAELREGLQGGETIILSPPADLAEGSKVKLDNQTETPNGARQTADDQ